MQSKIHIPRIQLTKDEVGKDPVKAFIKLAQAYNSLWEDQFRLAKRLNLLEQEARQVDSKIETKIYNLKSKFTGVFLDVADQLRDDDGSTTTSDLIEVVFMVYGLPQIETFNTMKEAFSFIKLGEESGSLSAIGIFKNEIPEIYHYGGDNTPPSFDQKLEMLKHYREVKDEH